MLLLISLFLMIVEIMLYLRIKHSIKADNLEHDILIQLKTFFGRLTNAHEFGYLCCYIILLFAAFFYVPIIFIVIFIQTLSIITDFYLLYLLKQKK